MAAPWDEKRPYQASAGSDRSWRSPAEPCPQPPPVNPERHKAAPQSTVKTLCEAAKSCNKKVDDQLAKAGKALDPSTCRDRGLARHKCTKAKIDADN